MKLRDRCSDCWRGNESLAPPALPTDTFMLPIDPTVLCVAIKRVAKQLAVEGNCDVLLVLVDDENHVHLFGTRRFEACLLGREARSAVYETLKQKQRARTLYFQSDADIVHACDTSRDSQLLYALGVPDTKSAYSRLGEEMRSLCTEWTKRPQFGHLYMFAESIHDVGAVRVISTSMREYERTDVFLDCLRDLRHRFSTNKVGATLAAPLAASADNLAPHAATLPDAQQAGQGGAMKSGADPYRQARPSSTLYVGGLPSSYSDADLEALFCKGGGDTREHILNCVVVPDKHCGFVTFDMVEFATLCMQRLQGQKLGKRSLRIRYRGYASELGVAPLPEAREKLQRSDGAPGNAYHREAGWSSGATLFAGKLFCLDMGATTQARVPVKSVIMENGGSCVISYVTAHVFALVVPEECAHNPKLINSLRGEKARQLGIPIVTPRYIHACVDAGYVLPADDYRVEPSVSGGASGTVPRKLLASPALSTSAPVSRGTKWPTPLVPGDAEPSLGLMSAMERIVSPAALQRLLSKTNVSRVAHDVTPIVQVEACSLLVALLDRARLYADAAAQTKIRAMDVGNGACSRAVRVRMECAGVTTARMDPVLPSFAPTVVRVPHVNEQLLIRVLRVVCVQYRCTMSDVAASIVSALLDRLMVQWLTRAAHIARCINRSSTQVTESHADGTLRICLPASVWLQVTKPVRSARARALGDAIVEVLGQHAAVARYEVTAAAATMLSTALAALIDMLIDGACSIADDEMRGDSTVVPRVGDVLVEEMHVENFLRANPDQNMAWRGGGGDGDAPLVSSVLADTAWMSTDRFDRIASKCTLTSSESAWTRVFDALSYKFDDDKVPLLCTVLLDTFVIGLIRQASAFMWAAKRNVMLPSDISSVFQRAFSYRRGKISLIAGISESVKEGKSSSAKKKEMKSKSENKLAAKATVVQTVPPLNISAKERNKLISLSAEVRDLSRKNKLTMKFFRRKGKTLDMERFAEILRYYLHSTELEEEDSGEIVIRPDYCVVSILGDIMSDMSDMCLAAHDIAESMCAMAIAPLDEKTLKLRQLVLWFLSNAIADTDVMVMRYVGQREVQWWRALIDQLMYCAERYEKKEEGYDKIVTETLWVVGNALEAPVLRSELPEVRNYILERINEERNILADFEHGAWSTIEKFLLELE